MKINPLAAGKIFGLNLNSTYMSMFLWSMWFITSVSSRAFRSVRFITIPVSLREGTVQLNVVVTSLKEHFNLLY
jgi:hypothetical protein